MILGFFSAAALPGKTAEAIVDGWYHTGDSGRIDEDGCLWITGRISEVFKTSKGKFVRPTDLESHFGRCPLLSQYCVMGHGLDQPAVLVSLSEPGLKLDRQSLQAQLLVGGAGMKVLCGAANSIWWIIPVSVPTINF